MIKKSLHLSIFLGGFVSASAQMVIPGVDASRVNFAYDGEMDFENGGGSLSISQLELTSILAKPFTPVTGVTVIPFIDYSATLLNFDGTGGAYPIDDEDLHSLSLSAFAISAPTDSRWFYTGFVRAEMATDFQDVNSDSFTFDIAAGVGYRVNECFSIGLGGAIANLNGNETFYPGINFDWAVNDKIRIGAYGPTVIASYTPCEDWQFSVRGENGGGVWNIADGGNSRSIDFSSYNVSLNASRRLAGQLWLTAGVGMTLANEIELTQPDGDQLFKQELDSGMFAQVGLRLVSW